MEAIGLGRTQPVHFLATVGCGYLWPTDRIVSPYFTIGRDMSSQICPFPWGTRVNVIHGSLGPPESTTQTASRSVQPFCRAHACVQQTDRHTDRQTDRQTDQLTPSYIDSNRPQIMLCMAMRPKNKPYEDRLKHLNLPTMKYRCIRGEMIEELKSVHNIYDSRVLPYTFLQFKR